MSVGGSGLPGPVAQGGGRHEDRGRAGVQVLSEWPPRRPAATAAAGVTPAG